MKKLVLTALVFIVAALVIMMFFNKPHLALAIGALGFAFILIAAAKHESNIENMYKDSNVLMCSEGVIRHIRLHK